MVDTLKHLSILILLVIYVPIAILIILKCKKMSTKFILLGLVIVSVPVLYIIIFSYIPYYELTPFEGKVIDADTKEPIEGAAVLAVYFDEGITIAGTNTYPIDAQETLTDRKGQFKIPEVKEWFRGRPGTVVEARIIIFKPEYGAFPENPRSEAVKEENGGPSAKKWITYALPKLKTWEDRKKSARLRTYHELPYEKQRLYVEAINTERKNLGLPRIQLSDEERHK